jgi:hypothetical protein
LRGATSATEAAIALGKTAFRSAKLFSRAPFQVLTG